MGASGGQSPPAPLGLLDTQRGKGGIGPTLPTALGVPDGLSMADKEEAAHPAIFADDRDRQPADVVVLGCTHSGAERQERVR
jgi:hypothetical protein